MKKLLGYESMSQINLRKLEFFRTENPLLDVNEIPVRKTRVRSGLADKRLCNLDGEVVAVSLTHQIKEVDSENFVKVFLAGIQRMYALSKAASKVFNIILEVYEDQPIGVGGYVDSVYIHIYEDMVCDVPMNMHINTFRKGLKELIFKQFLAPKAPNMFWVNPSLFFKGDRAVMITELRRKKSTSKIDQPKEPRKALEQSH